jgi:hypothetical protein
MAKMVAVMGMAVVYLVAMARQVVWEERAAGGASPQHSSHPDRATLPSDLQRMLPLEITTPSGPVVPQYLVPSISR